MKFSDTQLPMEASKAIFEEKSFDVGVDHIRKIYDIAVTGAANILQGAKSMEVPTAYVFERFDETFVIACIVQYFENEDDKTAPGNWNMTWTFYKEDLPENTKIISINNAQTYPYFRSVSAAKYKMQFQDDGTTATTLVFMFEQLKKWLDENASENEIISIELDGVFQARVSVEGGEKVFAFEADGEIKNLIKDDAAIEK